MNLPPSDFAAAFRDHVVPRIKKMLITAGVNVANGEQTWGEAYHDLIAEAQRLGLNYLPEAHAEVFRDWLAARLVNEIETAEPVVQAAEALAARCLYLPFPEAKALVRGFLGNAG